MTAARGMMIGRPQNHVGGRFRSTVARLRAPLRRQPASFRRRGSPASSVPAVSTSLLEHCLRYRLKLHVARALVDRADLGVAIELLGWIVLRVAVATEELERDGRHAFGHL